MSKRSKGNVGGSKAITQSRVKAFVAEKGVVKTSEDFKVYMSALMSDVIEGSINPSVANAASQAGGKLLRVVEIELKYGPKNGGPLMLAGA